jgi:hypothetical protein
MAAVSIGFSLIPTNSGVEFDVCDPVQSGTGMDKHIRYTVSANREAGPSLVSRRFSDFAWLRNTLAKVFSGCIVPPLPSKDAEAAALGLAMKTRGGAGERTADFNVKRARQFQLFLYMVANHDELFNSDQFNAFLTLKESELVDYKKRCNTQLEEGKTAGSKLKAWMGKKKEAVKESDVVGTYAATYASSGPASSEDQEIDGLKSFVAQLETAMKVRDAGGLTMRSRKYHPLP